MLPASAQIRMSRHPGGSQQTLGHRVQNLRDLRGWSLQDLADRLELDPTQLGRIERGDLDLTLSTLEEIADSFEVTTSDLLAGIERL